MKISKKLISMLLAFTLIVSSLCIIPAYSSATEVEAAGKVALSKKTVNLVKGKTTTLKLNNAKASKVKWSSSNKYVASVSKKGKVTAKDYGYSTITAKYKGKKYECIVCVRKSSLSANKSSVTTDYYKNAKVTVTLKSKEALYCKSDDLSVAEVKLSKVKKNKATLTVIPVKAGSTRVYVFTASGSYYAINVNVNVPWKGVEVVIPETIGSEGTPENRVMIQDYQFLDPRATIYDMKITFKVVQFDRPGVDTFGAHFYCYDKNGKYLDKGYIFARDIVLNGSYSSTCIIPSNTAKIVFDENPNNP